MNDFSIGAALGEGFGLIRRRPVSVLVWGLVNLVIIGSSMALMTPVYMAMVGQVTALANNDPAAMASQMAAAQQLQGVNFLLGFVRLFFAAVIYCAVYRSVLRPEQHRFAYLRIGLAELYFFLMIIAGYIAFIAGLIVAMIPVAIIVGILTAVHLAVVGVIIGILAAIAVLAGVFYLLLRFSMMGPMIVSDGKIHFLDAWSLTKGKVLRLFLVGLCLVAILLVGELVVGVVFGAIGLGVLSGAAGGMQNIPILFQHFSQSPAAFFALLTPVLIIAGLISIPLYGCVFAIMGAPWARVYRDLIGPDLDATFS